ncbi:hypothetical protein GCM10007036_31310 [Alsobacter metallidurans]|uniref:Carrier domain-containing protein n=1 Tax=Alsobacter metallidurans TaxID=340221 RepID=A0A917I9W4_9HYPH|nr:acyl carrier protein [Alsobacter metallidurans]GGH24722.1 hypothetical protein GCM10007036_31310 [Alsobacter metallidurans]
MRLSKEELQKYIESELFVDVNEFTDETLLFSGGLIDSFALVSLMSFIEKQAGIVISPSDVNLHNFDSISRIVAYADKMTERERAK